VWGWLAGWEWEPAVYYYEQLAKAHAERGRKMDFVMVHAETDRIFEYAAAGDRDGMAEYLCGFLRRLKAAGAEYGVIPAVTASLLRAGTGGDFLRCRCSICSGR